MRKRIIISVINDLTTDQRVNKVAMSLAESGYDVLLVGRRLKSSFVIEDRPYKTKRLKLVFNKTVLFYTFYNLRLFLFFLVTKVDIFLANDLDTLPANFFASKIRRKKLVFDSHELLSEVPELVNKKTIKLIWQKLENYFIPRLENCYTVCQSIADWYLEKYNVHFEVVRNIPVSNPNIFIPKRPIELPEDKIILYQGSLNLGRGLELAIKAMQHVDATLVIIGGGDIEEQLKELTDKLRSKVFFLGKVPFQELDYYTKMADVGISIEENLGLNYFYALPNKLFDYIHAEIPVLVSDFPEMKRIVDEYSIGKILKERNAKSLANILNNMLTDKEQIKNWKINLKKAKEELTWENEKRVLLNVFKNAK